MRIGILTGGGDVPGLNPSIKAVVARVAHEGHEVVGIRRGWGGLLNANPADPEESGEDRAVRKTRELVLYIQTLQVAPEADKTEPEK